MNTIKNLRCIWILILCLAVVWPCSAADKKPRRYTNQEFGFSLKYPDSWVAGPSPAPNSRIRLASPVNTQPAECVVIVKRYPHAVSAKQSDIDQVFLETPSASELKDILSQSASEVEVVDASSGKLHARPAHLARVQYKMDTQFGNIFVNGRVVMTATPGLTWTLSCGGQGRTAAEADKNFQFWQGAINSIVSSFTFTKLVPAAPLPAKRLHK